MLRRFIMSVSGVLLLLCGCGGGGNNQPPPAVSVSVTPTAANVHVTNTKQFTATVQNASNSAVTWSVSGSGCSGAACGTVSSSGLYTAPASVPTPESVTVTATSAADATKSDAATVSVLAAVVVAVTPASPNISAGAAQQFTATVQNAIDTSVTWSVSGPGCAGATCGTITAAGLYTAPLIVPSPAQITITATSNEDGAKSGAQSTTIISSVAVMVWPSEAQVTVHTGVNYGTNARQFGVLVLGTANPGVIWSVTGAGCSGNTCGTISNTGNYVPPVAMTSPATVTVTATSQADPGKSASATVELVASADSYANGQLNGTYAFFYQGFGANVPGQCAGIFSADGHGNITYGVLDRTWPNSVGGNLVSQPFTGAYTVGNDNRGTMSWSGIWGVVTFAFALNATGDKATMQAFFDSASTHMLGTFVKQDLSSFNNGGLQGDYAFQLLGNDSTYGRQAGVGRLHADGNGNITAGNIDLNDGVTVTSNTTFTGSYSVSLNSRATVSLTVSGVGTLNYVAYVISAKEFFLFSIDPITSNTPMMGGTAYLQSGGPYSNTSLNATTVFDLLGMPAANQPRVSIGLLTGDGNGHITGIADVNNNNTMSLNAAYTANYAIDASGRGTVTSSSGALPSMIFYLVSPNKALLMEAPGAGASVGMLEPQVQLPYGNALLIGQFASGGPNPPPYAANGTVTGTVLYDGLGSYMVTIDINSVSGGLVSPSSTNNPYSVAANGRVVYTPMGGGAAYAYLISPVKYVEILGTGFPTSTDDQKHLYISEQ